MRFKLLKHTRLNVVAFLNELPKTLHDVNSFMVDICAQTVSWGGGMVAPSRPPPHPSGPPLLTHTPPLPFSRTRCSASPSTGSSRKVSFIPAVPAQPSSRRPLPPPLPLSRSGRQIPRLGARLHPDVHRRAGWQRRVSAGCRLPGTSARPSALRVLAAAAIRASRRSCWRAGGTGGVVWNPGGRVPTWALRPKPGLPGMDGRAGAIQLRAARMRKGLEHLCPVRKGWGRSAPTSSSVSGPKARPCSGC